MLRDWDTGVAFGRALEQIRHNTADIRHLQSDQQEIRREVGQIRAYMLRGGLLLVLWVAAASANLPAERIGEIAGTTLKSLTR